MTATAQRTGSHTDREFFTRLPEVLHPHLDDLEDALTEDIPAKWDEDEEGIKFMDAAQPRAISHVLIGALHQHLVNKRIGFLYREKITRRDRRVLGKASRVSGKLGYYTDYDFLIEINYEAWRVMPPEAKVALIDHELCHCGVNEDDKAVSLAHDVEEFSAIVRRWGLWRLDLKQFGDAIREGPQLVLGLDDERTTVTLSAGGKSATVSAEAFSRLARGD